MAFLSIDSNPRCSASWSGCARPASPRTSFAARRISCGPGSSSRATASRTWRISSATSKRSPRGSSAPRFPRRSRGSPSMRSAASLPIVSGRRTAQSVASSRFADARAGAVHDPAEGEGTAYFVSRTVDRGTERYSAEELAGQLDDRAVSLTTSVTRHILSLACTCLSADVDQVLALVADIIMRPSFPEFEVDRRRGEVITLIRQDDDNPAAVAVDTLMSMLYGTTHPYGRRVRGTVGSVERVDRHALRRFHARHVVPRALCLTVVGDIEPARAIDAAQSMFGECKGWPPAEVTSSSAAAYEGRRCRVVPMMNKSQTDIAYGFTTITRQDAS